MGFDSKKFMQTQFAPRTEQVEVNVLSHFFTEKKTAKKDLFWTVRGLTVAEKIRCDEAAITNKSIDDILKAIAQNPKKIDEIRKAVGIESDAVPDELIRRLNQLTTGSVEPKIEHEIAVKLAETNPAEFLILTNKIMTLTAMGMDLAKSKPSGKIQT